MLKIAVCDDNITELKVTEQFLIRYSALKKSDDIHIKAFPFPDDLIEKICNGERYDIYILDIVMPEVSGIDIGGQIRKNDENAYIIYLTSSEDYALKSYRVRAFQYLLKPLSEKELHLALNDALRRMDRENALRFSVTTADGIEVVPYHQLVSAEYCNHTVKVSLPDGKVVKSCVTRVPFEIVIKDLLRDPRFMRCHNSFLINMQHVKMISNRDLSMDNGTLVPVAAAKHKQVKETYLDYLLRKNQT